MGCLFPLQAQYSLPDDLGNRSVVFGSSTVRKNILNFKAGRPLVGKDLLQLPCGRCMSCRLEQSRQWAVRMMHESLMSDFNCFVTLTFDDVSLAKMCPTGSLDRRHVQLFMKRLRLAFVPPYPDEVETSEYEWNREFGIRVFYCGEYGENLGRPHYHLCLFNFDFPDLTFYKRSGGFTYFNSDILSELWPFGHAVVTSFSFDTAAYVARYCTKKVDGDLADLHYSGKQPEFACMSRRPAIGRLFLDEFGESDVFSHDQVFVNGEFCSLPRYYDKYLESMDPARFSEVQSRRIAAMQPRIAHYSAKRLQQRGKIMAKRMAKLVRSFESSVI